MELFFYQHPVNFKCFDEENYTITSRQAVTEEINLRDIRLDFPSVCHQPMNENFERQLLRLLELLDRQELVVSVYNLSSILKDVGNRTVELEISEVLYIAKIMHTITTITTITP